MGDGDGDGDEVIESVEEMLKERDVCEELVLLFRGRLRVRFRLCLAPISSRCIEDKVLGRWMYTRR